MTFSWPFLFWLNAMLFRENIQKNNIYLFEMRMLNLTWWHSIALALSVKKMVSCLVKLAKVSCTIKSYHFCFKSLNFGEILKCLLEPGNKHTLNAIKALSTKEKTIGPVPEMLSKILAPEMAKETILSLELKKTGSPRDALKENGYSAEV